MAEVLTHSGRHVWVEILAGTPTVHQEAYVCVKCGRRDRTEWTGSGPANSVCAQGDDLVEPGLLHRPPGPAWWQPRAREGPGRAPVPIPFPSYLVCVERQGAVHPVLFHPRRPGFVVVRDPQDATALYRLLARSGWALGADESVALIRNPRQGREALEAVARQSLTRVAGVYWDLQDLGGKLAYAFCPFEVANGG